MGIEKSIYTPSSLDKLCIHAPRGLFRIPLPQPPPLSDVNVYPAAVPRMRGNHFRPYISTLACAIEQV